MKAANLSKNNKTNEGIVRKAVDAMDLDEPGASYSSIGKKIAKDTVAGVKDVISTPINAVKKAGKAALNTVLHPVQTANSRSNKKGVNEVSDDTAISLIKNRLNNTKTGTADQQKLAREKLKTSLKAVGSRAGRWRLRSDKVNEDEDDNVFKSSGRIKFNPISAQGGIPKSKLQLLADKLGINKGDILFASQPNSHSEHPFKLTRVGEKGFTGMNLHTKTEEWYPPEALRKDARGSIAFLIKNIAKKEKTAVNSVSEGKNPAIGTLAFEKLPKAKQAELRKASDERAKKASDAAKKKKESGKYANRPESNLEESSGVVSFGQMQQIVYAYVIAKMKQLAPIFDAEDATHLARESDQFWVDEFDSMYRAIRRNNRRYQPYDEVAGAIEQVSDAIINYYSNAWNHRPGYQPPRGLKIVDFTMPTDAELDAIIAKCKGVVKESDGGTCSGSIAAGPATPLFTKPIKRNKSKPVAESSAQAKFTALRSAYNTIKEDSQTTANVTPDLLKRLAAKLERVTNRVMSNSPESDPIDVMAPYIRNELHITDIDDIISLLDQTTRLLGYTDYFEYLAAMWDIHYNTAESEETNPWR